LRYAVWEGASISAATIHDRSDTMICGVTSDDLSFAFTAYPPKSRLDRGGGQIELDRDEQVVPGQTGSAEPGVQPSRTAPVTRTEEVRRSARRAPPGSLLGW
jgi:hypothetical protein